jgi:hypothetical protein
MTITRIRITVDANLLLAVAKVQEDSANEKTGCEWVEISRSLVKFCRSVQSVTLTKIIYMAIHV